MRRLLWVVVMLGACVSVGAQSNVFLDEFLSQEAVAYGPASYLVLLGAGRIAESDSQERALGMLAEQGWAIWDKGPDEPLSLGEYALLLMRSFEIEGGLMYRLSGLPRYAARELVYLGLIQGRARPGMTLSGERAVRILGRVLAYKEGRR